MGGGNLSWIKEPFRPAESAVSGYLPDPESAPGGTRQQRVTHAPRTLLLRWMPQGSDPTRVRRSRNAFPMTLTLDRLIAAAANIGESSQPVKG